MKISVIIPAYNCERFLAETLECLLNQTLKDIQIVIVNDGSIDGTAEVIERYANKYPFKEEGTWICKDPEFTISYSIEPNNRIIEESTLEWDGETIHVDVTFQVDTYCVSPIGTTAHADRLFNGTWEYRGEDLVFYIEEDFLFDGHFYEIVFSKVYCNP